MKAKQVLSMLLAVVMAGSLAACGNTSGNEQVQEKAGQSEQTEQGEAGVSEQSGAEEKNYYGFSEPVSVKVGISRSADFYYADGEDVENNQWMNLYRDNNIIPEVLYEVDSSQAETKMSTAIMSGNYPDVIGAKPSDFLNYAQTDVIADITDAFEEYATDELKEYLNADGGLALQAVTIDGRMYGIPQMGNSYDSVPVMFIRQDWLDNLGLEIPETMDELKTVAHAFTYDDPDQNGADDTYGLAIDGMNILWPSIGDASAIFAGFGAYPGTDGMAFVEYEDGTVTWGGTNVEGMKAGLQLLQDMYNDGSLAKDFITMDYNSIFEETGAGRCGIWFGPMWGAMIPANDAIRGDADAYVVSAPVPDGLNQAKSQVFIQPVLDNIYCVSSKCDAPEVLVKMMNLSVQKLCHPADTEEFYKYYGETYPEWKCSLTPSLAPLKNYDNFKMESAALQDGDTSNLNIEQLGDYEYMKSFLEMKEAGNLDPEDPAFMTGIGLYTVFGDPKGSYAAIDKMVENNQFIPSAYNSLPTEKMAENSATLKKLTVETIAKIITGESVDSYDTFIETWYALGGQDVIDDAQAWADAN